MQRNRRLCRQPSVTLRVFLWTPPKIKPSTFTDFLGVFGFLLCKTYQKISPAVGQFLICIFAFISNKWKLLIFECILIRNVLIQFQSSPDTVFHFMELSHIRNLYTTASHFCRKTRKWNMKWLFMSTKMLCSDEMHHQPFNHMIAC